MNKEIRLASRIGKGFTLKRGGDPANWQHYEKPSQSTEISVIGKVIPVDPESDGFVEPNKGVSLFLDGKAPIEAEVTSIQEGEKAEVKIKSKNTVELTLPEKEAFYLSAIKTDEKNIAMAKERIKHHKIRLRKLQAYLKAEERRREKALSKL